MIEQIHPIPYDIPDVLRTASTTQSLVPFIGAGVSVLAGCPDWDGFANKVLDFIVAKKVLNYAQLDQIKTLNARVKLSLAVELAKQNGVNIDYNAILKPSPTAEKLGDRIYSDISKIGNVLVTTNYDDLLDRVPYAPLNTAASDNDSNIIDSFRQIYHKREELVTKNIDMPGAVFHIHGSINDPGNMVITTLDYLNRYANVNVPGMDNTNPFTSFLEHLFKLKNVLFIGYGLGELEILEYVIQKGMKRVPATKEEPRHYVLQGFYSYQTELANRLEEYYRQFGIGLIPYSKDMQNWKQLVEVMDYYAKEIPVGPKLVLAEKTAMEGLLR